MKSKKGIVILSSVVAVCAAGLILSHFLDWPLDTNNTSGNISKSSRFSRKTTTESISNMEELILNDPAYKNGIVTAYTVMQTRAQQFSVLVDMSNEVAGDIPEYANVLDEMNKVYVTVNNVCASLLRAGENINATLNGEKRPDLAQNTINASLAYTTLQKQNKLASEFIEVTDSYVKKAEAEDRLLFVRDQWVDYQLLTAALEGDKEGVAEMEKKGSLLAAEKNVSTLGAFNDAAKVVVISSAVLYNGLGVETNFVKAMPEEVISSFTGIMSQATNAVVREMEVADNLNESANAGVICSQITAEMAAAMATTEAGSAFVKNIGWETVSNTGKIGTLGSTITEGAVQNTGNVANLNSMETIGRLQAFTGENAAFFNTVTESTFSELSNSFEVVSSSIKENGIANSTNDAISSAALCSQVGEVIGNAAIGQAQRIIVP